MPSKKLAQLRTRFVLLVMVTLIWCACLWTAAPVTAQSALETSSLRLVPEDAAFYGSALRLGEQYEAFVNSKAFKTLVELPVVQQLKAKWNSPDNPPAAQMMLNVLNGPELKPWVQLLADGLSNEVFYYGGSDFGDVLATFSQIQLAMNAAQFEALSSGRDPAEVLPEKILEVLSERLDTLTIPDLVIGFKVSDADAANMLVQRLEMMLGAAVAENPALKQRVRHEQIANSEFLSVQLDGSLIPWQRIPLDELDVDATQLDKVVRRVKSMTLTICLGVHDKYLLLSIGDTSAHLQSMGQSGSLLDRPELSPLREHADKPLTSIGYVGDDFMKRAVSIDRQLESLVNLVKGIVPLAPIDERMKQDIIGDVAEFVDDVKKHVPQPGAMMSFKYRTSQGYEGFSYNWKKNDSFDGSQPLTILDHVGGAPLMFFAMRGKSSPEDYDLLVKWLKKGFQYGERIATEQMDTQNQAAYKLLRQQFLPLVAQLDKANREMLIPALADGQAALVLDRKLTSSQWHPMLDSEKPLPMLEIGIVYGVGNVDLLKKGVAEYFRVAQAVLDKLHEIAPDEIPELVIPAPQSRQFPSGTVFFYTLPRQFGLDKKFAPNAGLSDDFAVLSLMPLTTKRLLDKISLQVGGPLADPGQLMAAGYCDFAGLVDAIQPWLDYGVKMQGGGSGQTQPWLDQVHTGMEVLKCFRGVVSATYSEDDATVTHSQWRFADLP